MKKEIYSLTKIVYFILTFFFLTSCLKTITYSKSPEFSITLDSLGKNLKNIIVSEKTNLNGYKKKTKKTIDSFLEIKIINGESVPSDDRRQEILAKKIALLIKQSLKRHNDYNYFEVFFVKHTGKDIQVSKWKSWIFKSEEL